MQENTEGWWVRDGKQLNQTIEDRERVEDKQFHKNGNMRNREEGRKYYYKRTFCQPFSQKN